MTARMQAVKKRAKGSFFHDFTKTQGTRDGFCQTFNVLFGEHLMGKADVRAAESTVEISAFPGFLTKMLRVDGRQKRTGQRLQRTA